MEAIILAGGLGTRLRHLVPDLPKPMAVVGGKPFLEIVLQRLAAAGFEHIVLSIGYMSEKIISHFGSQFQGMRLSYEIETSPLGTGGALRNALDVCKTDHAFVLNGDSYLELDYQALEDMWCAQRMPVIVGRRVEDVARYGQLVVDGKHVLDFLEKTGQGAGVINAGCYVLPKTILNDFARDSVFSLESDFLAPQVRLQDFLVYVAEGYFIDIGIPQDYLRAQQEMAGGKFAA
ncbi:nucleotidyltransferase family protein [Massilia sp. W12]|uniref:nucleotidyltransferase family protein n=1 Tax=Massilia sp. W12 TaxID=3126507 RepID=UPI0030D592A7